jgi:hypothetical protein
MPHPPIVPDWEQADVPATEAPQQVQAFPAIDSPGVVVACTVCGDEKRLGDLASKYGKPQLVGQVREKGLWEARCYTCQPKHHKGGLESIWRET